MHTACRLYVVLIPQTRVPFLLYMHKPEGCISDMYHIAFAGWYPAAVDQSPANIIISEFMYTTPKERMAA